MVGRSYEPNGRSFTEVIRSILNETPQETKKARNTAEGDIGQQIKMDAVVNPFQNIGEED